MMVNLRRVAGVLVLALGAFGTERVHAFDAQAFSPAVDPQGYWSVYSSRTAPKGRGYVGLWSNYARDPFQLVDDLYTGDFVASYSLTDWFEIGLDVPVSYIKSDFPGVDDGVDIDNLRLNGKFELIPGGIGGFGLALVPFVELPTGDADHLTSNGDVGGGGLVVAEFVMNRFRTSLNTGYAIKNKPFDGDDETDEILFGLGAGFLVMGQQPILGARQNRLELVGEIFGASAAQHDPFQDEFSTPVEFLLGAKWYGGNGLLGGLAAGRRITDGINGPDFRVVATVGYTWQPQAGPPLPPPPPPPLGKVVVTDEQITTLEPIHFDFDKATIKPVSEAVLQDIVKVMNERPNIRIRVESHTDARGGDAYNRKLSERRAKSTVRWLTKHGIDPSRLESVGYGESRPIASNDTDTGRAKNRRSEFHVISRGQG